MKKKLEYIKKYFDSRKVNKTAFCDQVQKNGFVFSRQYLDMILRGDRPLTEEMWRRINSVLKVEL